MVRRQFPVFPNGAGDALVQTDGGFPAQAVRPAGIHQLAVHPVGFAGIPGDLSLETRRVGNLLREFRNRDVAAIADVDDTPRVETCLHGNHHRVHASLIILSSYPSYWMSRSRLSAATPKCALMVEKNGGQVLASESKAIVITSSMASS